MAARFQSQQGKGQELGQTVQLRIEGIPETHAEKADKEVFDLFRGRNRLGGRWLC